MKVIGIGFQKTGTSSLSEALTILGYNVLGYDKSFPAMLFKEDYDSLFNIADKYDAYQDNPWAILYQQLDQRYHNSKFILTIRDEEEWLQSVVNHFGYGHEEMQRWVYGIGHPKGNESLYLERYRSHNENVINYFNDRKEDLCVLSICDGDGWDKLCDFLNVKIPEIDFPTKNRGKYNASIIKKTTRFLEQINSRIRYNLKKE